MIKKVYSLYLEIVARYIIRDGWKKAKFYKKHHWFYSQGDDCYIPVYIPRRESYLISLGNNVWITHGCSLINHDASIKMVKKALKLSWIDKVGKIDIKDNVFIGNHSVILPGCTIGSNVIVGCGSIVTKNIDSNNVVAGNPAKPIGSFDAYADKIVLNSRNYPWNENTPFFEMIDLRKKYFFNSET